MVEVDSDEASAGKPKILYECQRHIVLHVIKERNDSCSGLAAGLIQVRCRGGSATVESTRSSNIVR